MRNAFFYGAPALIVLTLLIASCQKQDSRHSGSGHSSDPQSDDRQGVSADQLPEPTGRSRNKRSITSENDRRVSLEKAIAGQETLVAEKRAALNGYIRANAVLYTEANDSAGSELNGVLDEKEIPKANQVGGFQDLKGELELELQNLERMKSRRK